MVFSARALAGAAALCAAAGLALVPAAAFAHTDLIYTEHGEDMSQFATVGKEDATVVPYGDTWTIDDFLLESIEIVDDEGYALGYAAPGGSPSVTSWDHEAGELDGEPVEIEVPLSGPFTGYVSTTVESLWGADALPDGTLITYLVIQALSGELSEESLWIAAVDPATGEATPLVDLGEFDEASEFYDLATDPVSGTSYAIGQILTLGSPSFAAAIDFDGGTIADPASSVLTSLVVGFLGAADFEEDGTLWAVWYPYDGEGSGDFHLLTTEEFSIDAEFEITLLTGALFVDDYFLWAVDGSPEAAGGPELVATGADPSTSLLVAAGALGLGALALTFASRRDARRA